MIRRLLLCLVTLAALALCFVPFSASAQTVRTTRTRNVVEDAACPPAVGWETRPERYTSASAATVAARVKKTCPVVPPVDTVPTPPKDTIVTPPPPVDTTPHHPPVVIDTTIRLFNAGVSYAKVKTGQWTGDATSGEASVRFICTLAKTGMFDPIVYAGKAGVGHFHAFYGNTSIVPSSTTESLVAAGNSTCMGGTANRTAYWVPMMVTEQGAMIASDSMIIYYKAGYQSDPRNIREIPVGLRLIAGSMSATAANSYPSQYYAEEWSCESRYVGSQSIPDCRTDGTDRVTLHINFPACWNGRDLDSPDHKSHMAYPIFSNTTNGSKCPTTHPVQIPTITEIFAWKIPAGSVMAKWRLSNEIALPATARGGFGAHADWMNGWDQAIHRAFVVNCLNARKDCQVGFVGDGRMLDYVP